MRKKERWVFGALALSAASPAMADVIFPAFTGPYVSAALFPWSILAIVASETVVYKSSAELSVGIALAIVIAANALSSFIGVLIGQALPSGLVDGPNGVVEGGADFILYFWLGFVLAYVLSVFIEGAVLKLARRGLTIQRCLKTSAIANAASYCLLVGIFLWQR